MSQWLNDTPRSPLRLQVSDEEMIGQFYNSWDGMYHLAKYSPDRTSPKEYLCGDRYGNFSPSRVTHERKKCPVCWEMVKGYEK